MDKIMKSLTRRELIEKANNLIKKNETDGRLTKAIGEAANNKCIVKIKESDNSYFYVTAYNCCLKLKYYLSYDIMEEDGITQIYMIDKTIIHLGIGNLVPYNVEDILNRLTDRVLDGLHRCDTISYFADDIMSGDDDNNYQDFYSLILGGKDEQ